MQAVNAYCEQFGTLDLMITLTFGNKWDECIEFVKHIKDGFPGLNDSKLDMLYCGVESMFFFKERVSKIKSLSFYHFTRLANLPKCLHYVVRLEFQMRAAPYVHIMLWLERRLSLNDIRAHFFFGTKPPDECEFMDYIVRSQMEHQCKP